MRVKKYPTCFREILDLKFGLSCLFSPLKRRHLQFSGQFLILITSHGKDIRERGKKFQGFLFFSVLHNIQPNLCQTTQVD